jgi:Fe2+ transport system protein FeoA
MTINTDPEGAHMPAIPALLDLDQAPNGAELLVEDILGERSFRRRLMELGLLPGTPISKAQVAPTGDPIELRVRGARLSIRRAEARLIQVRSAAAQAAR